MSEKIEPALTAEEWRGVFMPTSCEDRLGVQEDGDGLEFITYNPPMMLDKYKIAAWDAQGIAGVIAIANASLPDSDPRKITRQKVELVRQVANASESNYRTWNDPEEQAIVDSLRALANALASYLPPEPE